MLEKLQLQKVDGGATNREKLRFEAPGWSRIVHDFGKLLVRPKKGETEGAWS